MTVKIPAIPEPQATSESLRQTVGSLKEGMEILAGARGTKLNAAVTWQDLVNLRLITAGQVPKK